MLKKKFRMLDIGLIYYESYGKNGPVFNNDQGKFSDEGAVIPLVDKHNQSTVNELTLF